MDAANNSASESSMIAFLPNHAEWCKQDLPHMTLVYSGPIADMQASDFNNLAKDAALIAMAGSPFGLKVTGVEQFGPDGDKVDVLTFEMTPALTIARRVVEHWNASEYPFSPHATIGPAGSGSSLLDPYDRPMVVYFNRIMVGFGADSIVFKL